MIGGVWVAPGHKMGFPTAPKRRVSGRLKLQVKAPATNEEAEKDPREAFAGVEDLSPSLQFSFPRGFLVDVGTKDVIDRQKKNALHWLTGLDGGSGSCRGCHKDTSLETIEQARQLVEYVCAFLRDNAHNPATVVIGHQQDGTITVNFTIRDRELATIVHPDHFELGRYFEGIFVGGSESEAKLPLPGDCLSWLSEG